MSSATWCAASRAGNHPRGFGWRIRPSAISWRRRRNCSRNGSSITTSFAVLLGTSRRALCQFEDARCRRFAGPHSDGALAQTRRYFRMVLAPGGTRPAGDLIAEFVGRPFSFEALGTWLAGDPADAC